MAGSKKSIRIGVIAEENNDVEVLYEYTAKLIGESRFRFSQFVGHGSGTLRKKCRAWAENLLQKGCECIAVMHDSDGNEAESIRLDLEKELKDISAKCSVVLVAIEEVEAWLLADPDAIQRVFKMRKAPKIPKRPERIKDPKEYLEKLVRKGSKAQYLNTLHNQRIAAEQSMGTLDSCPSFASYPLFLAEAVG